MRDSLSTKATSYATWHREKCVTHVICQSWVRNPSKALSKKLYDHCLVLVGSMNRFDAHLTIELK